MDNETREKIGLLRHQIISPVLMESGRGQMSYFRSLENRHFEVPGRGSCRFKASTMKGWLNQYKKNGFPALCPKTRTDSGNFRKLSQDMNNSIRSLRKEHMFLSVIQFYELAFKRKVLGNPPICLATLRRFLKKENLLTPKKSLKARKRFEMGRFGQMWTGDFMHGPFVFTRTGGIRRKKAILMAFIDDHSRMIVGAEFGFRENTLLVEKIFKEAILTYGLVDKIYLDNGPSFSSKYLRTVCAHLKIGLVHSKPYDSPSRGKIERFFRTVRGRFLRQIHPNTDLTLGELNEKWKIWLRDEYHHHYHEGIGRRPIDRYQASLALFPMKRIDEESLNEFFMVVTHRMVSRDCIVSFEGRTYEVPPQFVGKKVELRYVQENPTELYLYDENIRVQKLGLLDSRFNAQTYRPLERDPHIPLHNIDKNGVDYD